MKNEIKTIVRGAYDVQQLRIQTGNRIVANFKGKLGQKPGMREEDIDKESQDVLKKIRASYELMTDGVLSFPQHRKFKGDTVISSYTELVMVSQYIELEKQEASHFSRLKNVLKDYPVYTEFLEKVKGCGPAMAAVIISEVDIHKCKYASNLIKYAGLDVAEDGRGRGRYKEHLQDREYVTKEGEIATKKSITFNPFLKTKLVGVLGSAFLRAGENKYSTIYRNYKFRLDNHPTHKDKSKGHKHNMAIRYMVKLFLQDLYAKWRALEGLKVIPPYAEGKLGIVHTGTDV